MATPAWVLLPERTLRVAWLRNRPLAVVGSLFLIGLVGTAIGLLVDPRWITGVPAWLKPAKFHLSAAIYSFTLLWLLTYVEGRPRLVRLVSWATAVALAVELALIDGAAFLGTTSHFNVSTPLHATVWYTMASFIGLVWLMNLATIIMLVLQRLPDPAFAWSLRLGLLISSVGMLVGVLMVEPTAVQLAAARATGSLPISGAHTVGVPDGGPGLPLVNWSTVAGDLRVPHFVGLHGLQALPLFAFLLLLFARGRVSPTRLTALVWIAGLGYLGLVVLLAWQALRGQSVVAPDGLTLAAAGGLVVAVAVAGATTLLVGRSAQHAEQRS